MSDTKFTPGPWVVSRKFVVGPQDKEDGQSFGMVVGVADVYGENRSSDACLIAAAPELYDALSELLDGCERGLDTTGSLQFYARKALAKARGEV